MALHFYTGGTTGAQDGNEISNGDLSSPFVIDGMYPAAGAIINKEFTVHLRADPGEVHHMVLVEIRGASAKKFYASDTPDKDNRVFPLTAGSSGYSSSVNQYIKVNGIYYYYKALVALRVTDVNVPLHFCVQVSGSETNTPDLSCKLYARELILNGAS